MQQLYTRNYFQIYFWNILAFCLSFLSVLLVSPRIANQQVIYGIYSVCIATTMVLTYADIGFVGAAYKYASECFSRNDREGEVRLIGFATYILILFVIGFSVVLCIISFMPAVLVRGLADEAEIVVASRLLFIVCCFSPVIVLNRVVTIIFGIRLEDYIYSRVDLLFNILKIASVFYFFRPGSHNIVEYYLFVQIMTLLSCLISLYIAKVRYHYNFMDLLRNMRFTREPYNIMKKFAGNSIIVQLAWILYFEIDLIVLGSIAEPRLTAYYAIGLSLLSYIRGLISIFNIPFLARFNHYKGQNDTEGMRQLFINIMLIFMPFIVLMLLALVMFMEPLIFTWVGSSYAMSVGVSQMLVSSFIYHFVTTPTSNYLLTEGRLKPLTLLSGVNCTVYWVFIAFNYALIGVMAFAVAKFITFTISAVVYMFVARKFLRFKRMDTVKRFVFPMSIPIVIVIVAGVLLARFLPIEKNTLNLLVVLFYIGGVGLVAICSFFLLSKEFRTLSLSIVKQLLRRSKTIAKNQVEEE